MKKTFLILILVLFLIPGSLVFAACKDNDYNISNLSKDFYAITENKEDNIDKSSNKIVFNLTNYKHENVDVIQYAMTKPVYASLNGYNTVFNNVMAFAFEYNDECSLTTAEIDKETRNLLKQQLDSLSKSIKDVNLCLDLFANGLLSNFNTITNEVCLNRYKNLIDTYRIMLNKAVVFSNTLENIFFNYVLADSNPNISTLTVDFDKNIIVNKLDSRIKYQISNLSKVYIETYVNNDNLNHNIIDGSASFNLNANEYLTKVNSINVDINEQDAVIAVSKSENKTDFYNQAVRAYNMQAILSNENYKFIKAFEDIDYLTAKSNAEATESQKRCVEIIENQVELVNNYNSVLQELIAITKR